MLSSFVFTSAPFVVRVTTACLLFVVCWKSNNLAKAPTAQQGQIEISVVPRTEKAVLKFPWFVACKKGTGASTGFKQENTRMFVRHKTQDKLSIICKRISNRNYLTINKDVFKNVVSDLV